MRKQGPFQWIGERPPDWAGGDHLDVLTQSSLIPTNSRRDGLKGNDSHFPPSYHFSTANAGRQKWHSKTSSESTTPWSWCGTSTRLPRTGGGWASRCRREARTARIWELATTP